MNQTTETKVAERQPGNTTDRLETKKGALTLVGSGIKSVGHITFETRGWIEQADLVVYCVADPATETWIKQHSRKSMDLYRMYGNEKPRIDTYNEMVACIIDAVRDGKEVCAVFYGHPGVFVHPGHKAIEILAREGYATRMLPAISAVDCLFADLGVDPATRGCQMFEATDLLVRARVPSVDSHVIIWQIGCVGDSGFNFAGYDNRNLPVLVDYLEGFYPADHVVILYEASQYPMCAARIEKMPLRDLRTARVTGISTLYLPPLALRPVNRSTAARLMKASGFGRHDSSQSTATAEESVPAITKAGGRRRKFDYYMATRDESELANYIAELAKNPRLRAMHLKDPEQTSITYGNITEHERRALLSGDPGRIRFAMKDTGSSDLWPEWEDLPSASETNVVMPQMDQPIVINLPEEGEEEEEENA